MIEPTPDDDTTDAIIRAGNRLANADVVPRFPRRALVLGGLIAVGIATIVAAMVLQDDGGEAAIAPATAASFSSEPSTVVLGSAATADTAAPHSVQLQPTFPVPPTTIGPANTVGPTTTLAATTTTSTTVASPPTLAFDPANPMLLPSNYGVLKDGTLTLVGTVTSAEQAADVRAEAVGLLGAAQVNGEFTVAAGADGPSGVVRNPVDVSFETGSATFDRSMRADLDVAILIMALRPEAKLHVIAASDELASERAAALIGFITESGIDVQRVTPIPASTAPAGDQLYELVITNLFRDLSRAER